MSFIKDLTEGKFLEHPIHLMLVHFPIALLPASVVFDYLGLFLNDVSFTKAAYYTLTGGVWSSIPAALFGAFDLIRIPAAKAEARKKGAVHMLLNILWISVFGVIWILRASTYPENNFQTPVSLIICTISMLIMFISNHFGGELTLREHIGSIEKRDLKRDSNVLQH